MILYLAFFFILGSAIGSFLNVVIDRTTRGETILGRSYCDFCRKKLTTLDLVPVLSFLILRGRCRFCRRKLSLQYPIVEIATGMLFALGYLVLALGQFSYLTLFYWLFLICILTIVFVVDFKYSLIPTAFIFAASLVSLFFNYFTLNSDLFVNHVFAAFGAALFFGAIVVLTRGRGMGTGDIFLGFLIGMVLGVQATVLAIFLAFFLGAVAAIALIIGGKKRFGQTIPFGPFLVLGFLISLFWQSELISWYLKWYI